MYIDASFATHNDAKSHSGIIIKLYGCTIMGRSIKQKIISKDSTEAELIALSDNILTAVNIFDLLKDLKIKIDDTTIYQDNKSVIHLLSTNNYKSRNKYIKMRLNLVKEIIDSNNLNIKYIPTIEMMSDLLTKPLNGYLFKKHVDAIQHVCETKGR